VAQQATQRNPVTSWSTVGEVRPRDGEGFELVRAASHCGAGALPSESSGAELAPFLILGASATPAWDPGAMDPGPVPGVEIALVLTARQLTGFSPEGKALYRDLATDRRTFRLEEGEEFVVPVALADDHARDVLGIREAFVRVRAGQAGRPGATEYGSVWIVGAAPRSKILVDGGTAGRAGADGTVLLSTVPVGQREVRVRAASRPSVARVVAVTRGRTVVVTPDPTGNDSPARLAFAPAGKNTEGFAEFRRARDGAVMVRIPEGEFTMGNLETEG